MDSDMVRLFFQEGLRRIIADEPTEDTLEWAQKQLARLGVQSGSGETLDIAASIAYFDEVMRKREERHALPPELRRDLVFPWESWNSRIDPLPGGMLAVVAGADGA